jgi:hypothetical protein
VSTLTGGTVTDTDVGDDRSSGVICAFEVSRVPRGKFRKFNWPFGPGFCFSDGEGEGGGGGREGRGAAAGAGVGGDGLERVLRLLLVFLERVLFFPRGLGKLLLRLGLSVRLVELSLMLFNLVSRGS